MPRSQGFARGDIDTAFPLDDKFLALRGRLSAERYYAATGVYFHVVAATWREAERKPGLRVVPDAADLLGELVEVGLLDSEGRVTTRAFSNFVGRARRQRKAAADRQSRNRDRKSREVTRDTGVTNGDSAPPGRDGRDGTAGTDVARATDQWDDPEFPVLSYLASVRATVQPTGNGYHRELVALVERQGADKVVAAMQRRHAAGDRSARQLIYGAANDLEPVHRGKAAESKGHHAQDVEEVERAFAGR